jgi:hypothetical protein
MFRQTQNLQVTPTLAKRILAGLVAAVPGTVFAITSTVHLYVTGPATAFADHVLTDFVEPVFHGYAPYTLAAIVGPENLPDGVGNIQNINYLATSGGSIPGEDVNGYFILDVDGATILGWEQFAAMVPINSIGDAVNLTLVLAPEGIWGGVNG